MFEINNKHRRQRSVSDPDKFNTATYISPVYHKKKLFDDECTEQKVDRKYTIKDSYRFDKIIPYASVVNTNKSNSTLSNSLPSESNCRYIQITEPKIETGYHISNINNRSNELKKIKKLSKKFNSLLTSDTGKVVVRIENEIHYAILTAEIISFQENKPDILEALTSLGDSSSDIQFRIYLIYSRLCKYQKDLNYKDIYVIYNGVYYLHIITTSTNTTNITIDITTKFKSSKILARHSVDFNRSVECNIM